MARLQVTIDLDGKAATLVMEAADAMLLEMGIREFMASAYEVASKLTGDAASAQIDAAKAAKRLQEASETPADPPPARRPA